MFYHLLYPLHEFFFGFNVFKYISFRAVGASITALILSFLIGPIIIRTLQTRQIGEIIRKNGPESHQKKQGTPTMGGIIVLISIILPTLLWAKLDDRYIIIILSSTLFMGFVGFIDDYMKVIKKYPKGLVAKYKLFGQLITGLAVTFSLYYFPESMSIRTSTSVPFIADSMINMGYFYIPFVTIVIIGSSNAVNLTDGLDGLATGLVAISTLVFGAIAYASGRYDFSDYLNIIYLPGTGELFVFCLAMVGACIGFLWFNIHPAMIFLGDTGSLALGTALGTLAALLKKELLLVIIGGVFVIESISVIVQVLYYKYTRQKTGQGKKLFKMAPIHHHFELSGWHENQVVGRFWIVGILLALLSLTTFKIQ